MPVITRLIAITAAADSTPPTLTSPVATTTSGTTASGTVSTNEGNGTLYRLASTNATELAATVVSTGASQAVSGTGSQSVTFTGLTANTIYYAHYVHVDAASNTSARVTSAAFSTDVTAPTLTSPAAAASGATNATGSVSTDDATGTLFFLASANATELAATVVSTGSSQAVSGSGGQNVTVSGLSAATAYYLHFVHRDPALNLSARVTSAQFTTTAAGGTITRLIAITSAGDVTAPTLTSPTATTAGPTSATGTVSTNEGNGTLYRLASANATELASTVIASGQSQAVSGTGSQSVTFTGLAAETAYYAHYVHRDAAGNNSARVTSAQFTTDAASGGGVITRLIAITPRSESISTISGSTAGSTITVTTGGTQNLFTNPPTLTYGGVALTSINVTGTNTFTAVMPSAGFGLGSSNNFVLTVLGASSAPAARTFGSALGQFDTLTVPFASFAQDSFARDNELVGLVEGLEIGDQIETALKTNGTASTPAGYDVHTDGLGNLWATDPAGSEGNLADETEGVAVDLTIIDVSDGYSRSDVMTVTILQNMPSGTLTLSAPVYTNTTAALAFNWTGVNATGFQYRVNGGSWTAIASSPISLTGLTASTAYTYSVRAVNGSSTGDILSGSFTTSAATDLTPDPFTFVEQSGAEPSTLVTSNSITVTGVAAATNVAISVEGGEYSVSTDLGVTWGAWTATSGNVQLNHRVRCRLTSSSSFTGRVDAAILIGGVEGVFAVNTTADNVNPVVTLSGSASITLPIGTAWTDPGSTAVDNLDGAVDVVVTGTVNTAAAGVYTLTYTATDQEGNVGTSLRQVTVVAAGNLTIDSAPALINRGGLPLQATVSGAAVAPTLANTSISFGGAALYVDSITGTGPWVINFVPWRAGGANESALADLQLSNNGYPLTVTVGAESATTGNIPFPAHAGTAYVNLTSVATGAGTIDEHFTEFALAAGDQIFYRSATVEDSIGVTVSPSGVITYATPPTRQNTFWYVIIRPNLVGASEPYTYGGDAIAPVITLNGLATLSLLQGSTWTDPGATALDSTDGNLTDQIVVTGTINTATLGQQALTYTVTDAAGNTASAQRQVYVYAVSTSYTDARDTMRVSKPNNLVYLHTGVEIPTTSAKDPNARIFKGFELLGFSADEIILDHSILINGTVVDADDTVDGLIFHGTQGNGINKVKAEISGGTLGETYRLTLRFTTQYTPSDDRSQDFLVMEL